MIERCSLPPTVTYIVVRIQGREHISREWEDTAETVNVAQINRYGIHAMVGQIGRSVASGYFFPDTGNGSGFGFRRIHPDDLAALKAFAEAHGGRWEAEPE